MYSEYFFRTHRTTWRWTLACLLTVLLWAPPSVAADDVAGEGPPRAVGSQEVLEESDEDDISRPIPMPETMVDEDVAPLEPERTGFWSSILRRVALLWTVGLGGEA